MTTKKNNTNIPPPPAAGILEKAAATALGRRKKQGQALGRFNLRRAPADRQPRTSMHASAPTAGLGFEAAGAKWSAPKSLWPGARPWFPRCGQGLPPRSCLAGLSQWLWPLLPSWPGTNQGRSGQCWLCLLPLPPILGEGLGAKSVFHKPPNKWGGGRRRCRENEARP